MSRRGRGGAFSNFNVFSSQSLRLVLMLMFSIFLFICSLEGVKESFRLIFSEWQSSLLSLIQANTAPIISLALGMLTTALVQSSSAVIAATMVSMSGMVAGGLPLAAAIKFGVPMVLGANIGTTITNTIVAFGVKRGMTTEEFKSTIPGVIVDDVYEALTISLFFTLELVTGFLSNIVIGLGNFYTEALKLQDLFAMFNKTVIDIMVSEPIVDPTTKTLTFFLGNKIGGILLFVIWFGLIILSMGLITKGLERLIESEWKDTVVSAFKSPFRGFITGFSITWMVGSSSIGTSLVIPFLATGLVNLKKAYPYLCGCNLATTMDLSQIYGYFAAGIVGLMLGSAHIILNIFALMLWLVSPLRFLPVEIAGIIGNYITSSRHVALWLLFWVFLVFFVAPLVIIYYFGFS